MKKYYFLITVAFLLIGFAGIYIYNSYWNYKRYYKNPKQSSQQKPKYFASPAYVSPYPLDDQLDIRAKVKINQTKFKEEMTRRFPPDTLLKYFGPGTFNFYLKLKINQSNVPASYTFFFDLGYMYGNVPAEFRHYSVRRNPASFNRRTPKYIRNKEGELILADRDTRRLNKGYERYRKNEYGKLVSPEKIKNSYQRKLAIRDKRERLRNLRRIAQETSLSADENRSAESKPSESKPSARPQQTAKTEKTPFHVFYSEFPDANGIFDTEAGMLDGRKVSSIKYYEIKVGVDKNKKIIYNWTITELDQKKYQPKFNGNYTREDFRNYSGMPRIIIGGYESVSSRIKYPEEAKKNGVTGRVILNAFVDENGSVVGTQLYKGIGFGCDEAAAKAVSEVKFYPDPNGKFESVIPIDFELVYKPKEFDLTSTNVKLKPEHIGHARPFTFFFNYINTGSKAVPTKWYNISLYIDNKLVFTSVQNAASQPGEESGIWAHYGGLRRGTHEYTIYIDPENKLKESNRSNNIIKGTFEVH
ncbi:MAG: TonB family protein [Bacillota bacterium]